MSTTICENDFPTTISLYGYAIKRFVFLQFEKLTRALINGIALEKVKKQKNGLKA